MSIDRRHVLAAASAFLLGRAGGGVAAPVPVVPVPSGQAAPEVTERLLLVGDSQAQGLAAGMQRLFRHEHSVKVIDHSRIATGLASAVHYDWPPAIAEWADADIGGIAIVMFGANDRPPIRINGHIDQNAVANFTTLYGGRIKAVVDSLKKFSKAVIWVGHPITRDPVFAEDMLMLNKLFAANATEAGAEWFPCWKLFLDADGNYSAFGKGVDGVTTRLRADDGVHMTMAGYDVLAHALAPQLAPFRAVQASG